VVEKRLRVVEEIWLTTHRRSAPQRQRATLRSQQVEIERQPINPAPPP